MESSRVHLLTHHSTECNSYSCIRVHKCSLYSSISSGHNLVTGLVRTTLLVFVSLCRRLFAQVATVEVVLTFAVRTYPSRLVMTSTTRASGHCPLEWFSSARSTKSPTFRFLFGVFHFLRSSSVGKYSLVHLAQNTLLRYCACRHCRLAYTSSLVKVPGGRLGLGRKCRRWLGVKGRSSSGLSLFRVSGLLFKMFTTSAIMVERTSSLTNCSFCMVWDPRS